MTLSRTTRLVQSDCTKRAARIGPPFETLRVKNRTKPLGWYQLRRFAESPNSVALSQGHKQFRLPLAANQVSDPHLVPGCAV